VTAACGGGTSGPKTGTAAVVDFTAGALGALLSRYPAPWTIPAIGLVSLAPLTLSVFCGTDPPTSPTFTQAEVDAVLQLQLGPDFDRGVSKMRDWFYNVIWWDQCQCTSGTQAPITVPSQPSGSITPVFPAPAVNAPCSSYFNNSHGIAVIDTNPQTGTWIWQFFDGALNQISSLTYSRTDNQADLVVDVAIPVGTRSVGVTYQWSPTNQFFTGGLTWVPGATSARLTMRLTYNSTTHLHAPEWGSDVYCNGQLPGATQTPCCPPDAATAATLSTILDLVQAMQRSYHPFAYVASSSHAGLTGTGSFPVSRLVGVHAQVTTYPSGSPILGGNPPYVKDLGWISVSDGDGMIQERRLSQLEFVWFPQVCPLADQVNYFLEPGVTLTLTELKPEP